MIIEKQKSLTWPQVFKFLISHLKTLVVAAPFFLGLFGTVGAVIWELKAEPEVKALIDTALVPLEARLKRVESKDLKQDTVLNEIRFATKQQLYLLKRLAGKQAVRKMEDDTRIFAPH